MQQPRHTPPLKQQRNETIMNLSGRCLFRLSLLSALTVLSAVSTHAQQWTVPTPEELSMTSQPEVPGSGCKAGPSGCAGG